MFVFVCFVDAEERGADGEFSAMSEDEREARGSVSTASATAAAAAGRRAAEGKAASSDLDCRNPMFHAANANAEKAVARSVLFPFDFLMSRLTHTRSIISTNYSPYVRIRKYQYY